MTAINLQANDITCPYCNSDNVDYDDSNYYPDYIIESWKCNDCNSEFGIKLRTQILDIFKA